MEDEKGIMAEEIKCLFLKHRVELTENIVLDEEMWNRLRASKVLSAAQRDRIQHNKTHNEQISDLLDFLGRRSNEDFLGFCDALRSTNQNHIVTGFLTPSSHNEVPSTKDIPGDASQTESGPATRREKTQATSGNTGPQAKDKRTMREDSKKLLRVNREDIIDNLDLDKAVWKELIKAKIILDEKARWIQGNYRMAEDQVAPFLDHLIRRPEDDFNKFCNILKECNQGHIVDDYLTKE